MMDTDGIQVTTAESHPVTSTDTPVGGAGSAKIKVSTVCVEVWDGDSHNYMLPKVG